jgi:hypothetical protein
MTHTQNSASNPTMMNAGNGKGAVGLGPSPMMVMGASLSLLEGGCGYSDAGMLFCGMLLLSRAYRL